MALPASPVARLHSSYCVLGIEPCNFCCWSGGRLGTRGPQMLAHCASAYLAVGPSSPLRVASKDFFCSSAEASRLTVAAVERCWPAHRPFRYLDRFTLLALAALLALACASSCPAPCGHNVSLLTWRTRPTLERWFQLLGGGLVRWDRQRLASKPLSRRTSTLHG